MQIEHTLYDFIYRRASYPMWLKYRINKMELRMLGQLSAYLMYSNKTIIGKQKFFNTMTNNIREKKNMEGYLNGLLTGGFVGSYEYISQPDGVSIGLSDLGVSVLRDFEVSLTEFKERYKPSPYRINSESSFIPSVSEEPRARYVPRQQA